MLDLDYWSRMARKRLSRRTALRASAAGLGVATLGIAGCGGDSGERAPDEGTPGGVTTPQPGGTMTIGLSADPGGLDPQACVTCSWVAASLHGFLYFVDLRDQSIMLQIADSFERVDELTYVWTLKPGVKFHNVDPTFGREVDADDVVYSFQRRRDDPKVQNSKVMLKNFTDHFEATDKSTFRLVTSEPFSPAYDEIGDWSYAIVPKEAVEKYGDLTQHSIGCGAFILEEFVRGERIRMRRNPDFYMAGRPYLETRNWMVIPDQSTLLQAFRTGQHDYCGATLDKLKVDELKRTDGVVVAESPLFWTRTLLLKCDRPPFNDIRVRQAIDLAVNRQDLLDKIAFGEGLFNGCVVPALEYWSLSQDELREFYKVDLAEAKQLLSAAGYADGLKFEMMVENVVDLSKLAEVVKEHLAKIDVTADIQVKELAVFLTQHLYPGVFEACWYLNLPWYEPDKPLCQWHSHGQAGTSFSGYNNPKMDEWIAKERAEFDPEERRQIIHDAQRAMMNEHGPQINLVSPTQWIAYWDRVHGPEETTKMGYWGYLGTDVWLSQDGA